MLNNPALSVEWPARVARISDIIDPATRSLGVIVEVDKPYAGVQPGVRPPLAKGLFVNVELSGRPRPDSLVIPRNALHKDRVYVVTKDSRLAWRQVVSGLTGADYVVISEGLEAGERLVISDLQPAIDGMLLQVVDDPEALARLLAVTGTGEAQP
jgi:multidrug efflux pump subunit AcrA (membrane-fusion protein)